MEELFRYPPNDVRLNAVFQEQLTPVGGFGLDLGVVIRP
jgi:hypothetical protein